MRQLVTRSANSTQWIATLYRSKSSIMSLQTHRSFGLTCGHCKHQLVPSTFIRVVMPKLLLRNTFA
jgi:hypothetical protein